MNVGVCVLEGEREKSKFIIFQLQLSQKQFSYCEHTPIPGDFLTFSREELRPFVQALSEMLKIEYSVTFQRKI